MPAPTLRIIEGGRRRMVVVPAADHEGLRLEVVAAREERAVLAVRLRAGIHSAMRQLATGHQAAAGTVLVEMLRLVEQEAVRAASMSSACPCGLEGAGHGDADGGVLPMPLELVA